MPIIFNNAFNVFDSKLRPFKHIFEIESGQIIELSFEKGAIMHMLGLQNFPPYSKMKKKGFKAVGSKCYSDLKKSKIKEANLISNKNYADIKEGKIDKFHLYSDTLEDTDTCLYLFDPTKLPNCKLKSKYILYNKKTGYHCHIGLKEDNIPTSNIIKCNPETWFIRDGNSKDKYIKDQVQVNIKSYKKIRKATESEDIVYEKK